MSDSPIAIKEKIAESRAAINQAVKIDAGRRALEGDIQSADMRLEDALEAIDDGRMDYASTAVSEAIAMLDSDEADLIAEDTNALNSAIHLLGAIDWP